MQRHVLWSGALVITPSIVFDIEQVPSKPDFISKRQFFVMSYACNSNT